MCAQQTKPATTKQTTWPVSPKNRGKRGEKRRPFTLAGRGKRVRRGLSWNGWNGPKNGADADAGLCVVVLS